MAKIDSDTRKVLKDDPRRAFHLIVRVTGAPQTRAVALEEKGIKVRRRFRMTNSLGIECTGDAAVRLARLSWVDKIELDRPVSAFRR